MKYITYEMGYTIYHLQNGSKKYIYDDGFYILKNDVLHCENGPAEVNTDIKYYVNGKLHRKNGPAIITAKGELYWYINGVQHRNNGPAYIGDDTLREICYYNNGKLTRAGSASVVSNTFIYCNDYIVRNTAPAVIANDCLQWRTNGLINRHELPAYISTTSIEWYKNGRIHRLGGRPAVINQSIQYYRNGRRYNLNNQ